MRLALRNAVAEAIIAALAARASLDDLRTLIAALAPEGAAFDLPRTRRLIATGAFQTTSEGRVVLLPELAAAREAARTRATRALALVERYWRDQAPSGRSSPAHRSERPRVDEQVLRTVDAALETALVQAALLFNAGLFFEVHEVLEAVWHRLRGEPRDFVQGLIQIAVALHHFEQGNRAGARTLFAAGRAKLAPHVPSYRGVAVGELLAAITPWEGAAENETPAADLAAPTLQLHA
jgi:predicted metal-dependent hydrolase